VRRGAAIAHAGNGCRAGLALDAAAVAVTGRPGAAALAEAAARGDQVAISVIRSHAELFARGLDGLCAVLAPQLLILGGGIIARSGPVATAYLAAASKLRWYQGETRTAALGDDARLIGAALAVQQELTNPG
jgi:glucokinase